jgi:putative DNA methylase
MLLKAILRIEDPNVMEQMLLLFSGTLEFNNMFCSPKGLGTGAVRPLFAHHAFIPAKEPMEANLWGVHRSSGGFSTLYQERLCRGKAYAKRPSERRLGVSGVVRVPMPGEQIESPLAASFAQLMTSPDHRVLLLNRSSTCLAGIPPRSVDAVVTDPPYWSNVMYSELADFFYVWLRLALRERYPEFAPPSARREDEAVVNPEQDKEAGSYREILSAVFRECHRVLKDEGLLVFTFHHGTAEAWDALAEALREAGFAIQRVWPVYAEMDVGVPIWGKESVKFDAVLVCRKGGAWGAIGAGMETEALVNNVREEVRALVKRLEGEFSLSQRDWNSLARAVAAMFYTRGETALLPSAVDRCGFDGKRKSGDRG